jgi:hypothetical protein
MSLCGRQVSGPDGEPRPPTTACRQGKEEVPTSPRGADKRRINRAHLFSGRRPQVLRATVGLQGGTLEVLGAQRLVRRVPACQGTRDTRCLAPAGRSPRFPSPGHPRGVDGPSSGARRSATARVKKFLSPHNHLFSLPLRQEPEKLGKIFRKARPFFERNPDLVVEVYGTSRGAGTPRAVAFCIHSFPEGSSWRRSKNSRARGAVHGRGVSTVSSSGCCWNRWKPARVRFRSTGSARVEGAPVQCFRVGASLILTGIWSPHPSLITGDFHEDEGQRVTGSLLSASGE